MPELQHQVPTSLMEVKRTKSEKTIIQVVSARHLRHAALAGRPRPASQLIVVGFRGKPDKLRGMLWLRFVRALP